ncbi:MULTISPECIES: hemerythrin domain-containing protein [Sulfurimonas]|uniref:hemerythrin domain-containing protein n=1 Tax=Sulfurimonas TaxID=202746 RepID=UPI0012643FBA|nr:hemerythrin domain-containing protein [Sulfurimonas indica]
MFNFLSKKDPRALNYDNKLIKKFHKDHEKLIKAITKISKALEKNEEKKAKTFLKQFKTEILGHFMEEDIKLYRYLKKYYTNSSETMELVQQFEGSIKTIQKDVIKFLDTYTQENKPLDKAFETKFYAIVDELGTRIKTEENNLYTLYIK